MNTINYKKINLYHLKLENLIFNEKKNHFMSKIYYEENGQKTKLLIKSPNLKLISVNKTKNKIYLELEFLEQYPDFYFLVNGIDNYFIDYLSQNSQDFFGQKCKNKTLENLFVRTIKIPKKITTKPTFSVLLDDKHEMVDKLNKKININDLEEGNNIILDLFFEKLVLKENKYYISVRTNNIILDYSCLNQHDYNFSDSDSFNTDTEIEFIDSIK